MRGPFLILAGHDTGPTSDRPTDYATPTGSLDSRLAVNCTHRHTRQRATAHALIRDAGSDSQNTRVTPTSDKPAERGSSGPAVHSDYVDIRVIVVKDVLVIAAPVGHTYGAPLAHADSMTPSPALGHQSPNIPAAFLKI